MRFLLTILLLTFSCTVFAQELLTVNTIEIEGNKITKRATILRELSFQIGEKLHLKTSIKNL